MTQKLGKSLYVDNCVTSVDNEEELRHFMKYSTDILAEAKMDLRMWTFGPVAETCSVFNSESTVDEPLSVLGVLWERKDDYLSIGIRTVSVSKSLSKREVLSLTQSIFDPLGFLTPTLLPAKLLLREIWATKADWDSPLSADIESKFLKWYNNLQSLTNLKIPRRIGFGDKSSWSLHVFCDASQHAFATVIFLRCELNEEIFVSFVAAKSRVAPSKGITIPRLELMACVLGARLAKYVTEALLLENNPKFFWTDSTTALSWIRKNDLWGTFVGNRVREICNITSVSQWSYVPGQSNPADLPSRGCSPLRFIELAWWKGPVWLKEPEEYWPRENVEPDEALVFSERKKGVNLNINVNVIVDSKKWIWYERFSKFSTMIRVLSWVKRFINNCRKQNINKETFLSASELKESRDTLLSLVQLESFPETGHSVHGLLIEKDQNNLLRVKTKILERKDTYAFKYPILLPSKHYVVQCLVREYHLKNAHAGIQTLTVILREEFWILAARRTIRTIVKKCVRCQRYASKPPTTVPIHLPSDRVRDASTFEITGCDLCGPLILKNKTKAWVVLFTCAVYRCVHLELVTSISTECFISSFRRFIARRGRPSVIYTDNGTNFIGTSSALKKINWEKIVSQETLNPITWKFIPPTAAWWGGWWERLIRTTKNLLVKVLGQASVSYEELLTIICDVESVINCRPLTYISNDTQDLVPLTPSMFLQDLKTSGTTDLDIIDNNKLLVRQRLCQELREQLRSRFRKEYLGQLVQKHGPKDCTIKVGDVVLVGFDNMKRINWPMARVHELCTGRDGRVRVVKLKTKNGILVRPVRKLYPLELCSCKKDSVV